MLSPLAQQANVHIELDLENDCPVLILEDDLYQIVFNLMENGIKYNQSGGTLYVKLNHSDDNAILTVRDTGMGIPQDSVEHIFERFFRVDKARSRASGGSGLGLAIVKAIVQRNRGEITVDSTLGKGSCFTVVFPSFETEVDKD
jgi:signal transduction histidine kinase